MATETNLFAEAWGSVSTCVAKGQCENMDSKGLVRSSRVGRATSRKLNAGLVENHI